MRDLYAVLISSFNFENLLPEDKEADSPLLRMNMSLTELDDDIVRSMAIGAVFSDFVSFTFSYQSLSLNYRARINLLC